MLQTAAAKWLAGVLLAIALVAGGYMSGRHNGGNAVQVKCDKVQQAAQVAVIKQDAKVADITATQASDAQAVGVQVTHETEQIHAKAKQFIVKVPVYIPASADCHVNAGFVRMWDDSNSLNQPVAGGADGGQQPAPEAAGAGQLPAPGPAAGSQ